MYFGLNAKNNRGKQEEICQIYFVELLHGHLPQGNQMDSF